MPSSPDEHVLEDHLLEALKVRSYLQLDCCAFCLQCSFSYVDIIF